jgi:hypothetical protein
MKIDPARPHQAEHQHPPTARGKESSASARATAVAGSVVNLSAEALAAQQLDGTGPGRDGQLANNPLWHLIHQFVQRVTGADLHAGDIASAGGHQAPVASSDSPSNDTTPATAPIQASTQGAQPPIDLSA